MYVLIVLAILVTVLVIILSTAVHLVSILTEESDDAAAGFDWQDFSTTPVASPNDNMVGGHQDEPSAQAASSGCKCGLQHPAVGGADEQSHHEAEIGQPGQHQQPSGIEVPSMSLISPLLTADSAAPVQTMSPRDVISAPLEDVRSAELNSRLIKESESRRRENLPPAASSSSPQPPLRPMASNDSQEALASNDSSTSDLAPDSRWAHKPPDEQRSMISSKLGQAASKLIFDDFDPREMQLGGTALHWCRSRKSLDKLLKLGLPTDIANKRSESAVHVAVRRHKLQVLIGLLVNDAPVDGRNESGETPLIVACKLNDIFAAQLLLVFDADYDATDRWGHSARHYTAAICARHMGQQQMPSAAHLILAMLSEIGARRCIAQRCAHDNGNAELLAAGPAAQSPVTACENVGAGAKGVAGVRRRTIPFACSEGCSHSGAYEGNSYNRWPDFKRESLYKRHMFADLIETKLSASFNERFRRSLFALTTGARQPPSSRLLCIDGGGMRGVIVCQIMIEMERYLRRPMVSYFDWIGGTSVGAFLACALCRGATIREMRRVCFDVKDEVFSGSRPYNSKFLERVLKRTYGSGTRMSQVRGVKLAVTTVLADREPCQLKLFRNYQSPGQLLETHGYSQDTFDNMSGHSVISGADATSSPSSSSSSSSPSPSCQARRLHGQLLPARRSSNSRQPIAHADEQLAAGPPDAVAPVAGAHKLQGMTIRDHQFDSRDAAARPSSGLSQSADTRGRQSSCGHAQQEQRLEHQNGRSVDLALKCSCCDNISKPGGGGGGSPGAERVREDRSCASDKDATTAAGSADAGLAAPANQSQKANKDPQAESILDENDPDPVIWQAVRASAAAPFFFRPYGPYLDGGIISNNPTLDMLSEFENYQKVRKFLRGRSGRRPKWSPRDEQRNTDLDSEEPSKLDLVVSLGTGRGRVISRQTMLDFGQVASGFATVFSPVELVRSIRAARDLFKKLMQQSCHTEDHILDRAQAWCSSLEVPYFRINPPLATIFSIDDKRDEQLINALWQTKLYMRTMKDQLEQLGRLLDDRADPSSSCPPDSSSTTASRKRHETRE